MFPFLTIKHTNEYMRIFKECHTFIYIYSCCVHGYRHSYDHSHGHVHATATATGMGVYTGKCMGVRCDDVQMINYVYREYNTFSNLHPTVYDCNRHQSHDAQ